MAGDEPPFLPVGTEVSAKYRGAFCEAKVKKIVRSVKCKIYIKETLSSILVTDDSIVKGVLKVGSVVEVKYGESGQNLEGVITKLTDCSMYTVVFDDGDEKTLRRTQCCLKGEKHFIESETLDNLPLSHPEHFGTPVIHNKTKRRVNRHSVGNDDDIEDSSSDESLPKRACYRGRNQELVGKVMQVEIGEKKKQQVPVLVILPDAHNVELKTKDHLLVKSFKDGKFHTFHRKELKEFSKDLVAKNEDKSLKSALEKAVAYFDNQDLPSSWERDELLGTDEEEPSDEDESSDDEPNEEKDRFVAQLYKFMDDRGTPINKAPCIGNKDLNLYRLFKILQNLGGYNKVTNHLKWRLVYNKMGLPPSNTASHQIKTAYKKYLHAFEDFYRKLGSTMGTISRPGRSRHNSGRGMVAFRGQVKEDAKKDDKDSKDGDKDDKKSDSMDSDVEEESPSKIVKSPPRRERISRADMVNKEEKEKAENVKEMRRGEKKEEDLVKRSPMRKDDGKKEESAKKVKILKKEEKKKDSEDEKDDDKQKKVIRRRSMRKDEGKKDEKKDEGKKDDIKKEEEDEKETSSEIVRRSEKDSKAKSKTAEKKEKKDEIEMKQRKREESRERNEDKKEETTIKKEKAKITKKDTKKDKKNEEEEKDAEKMEKKVTKKDAKKQKGDEDKEKVGKKKGKVEEDDSIDAEDEEETDSKSVHKELPLGTRLQVRYGRGKNQKVYDAKIMEIQRDSGQLQYLVHYAGWNNRYDEWIRPERIVNILNKPVSDTANKKKNKESPPKSPKGQVSKPTRKSLPNQTPPHTTPQPRATSDVRPVKKSPCTTPSSTPGSVSKQTKMRPTRSNSIEFKVVDTLPAKARRSRRSSGLTETSDIISQESDSEVDEDTETEVDKEDVESLKPSSKVEEEEDNQVEGIAEKSPEMPEIVKDLGNFYEECDMEKSNESFKDEDTDSANESNILPVELDLLNRAAEVKRDDELNNLKETSTEVSSEIKKADNKSKVEVNVEKKPEASSSETVDSTDKDKPESTSEEKEEHSELISKSGKIEATVEKVSENIDKQESQNKEKAVVEEKVEVPVKFDAPPQLDDKYVFKDEDEDFFLSNLTSDKDWRERFAKDKDKEKVDGDFEKKPKGRKKEWNKPDKKETPDDKYVFKDEDEDFLLSNFTSDKDWRERFTKEKDKEKSDGESEKKTKGRKKETNKAEKKETPVKEKKDTKRGRQSLNEKKALEQNIGKQEDVADEPPLKKAKETKIEIEDKQAEIKEKVENRSNIAAVDSSDKNQEEVKKEENEVEKKKVKKKVKKKAESDTVIPDQKKEGKKEVGKMSGKGPKGDKVASKTKSRKNKESSDGEKDTSSSDQGVSEMCEEKVIDTDCSLTLLASSAEGAIANNISSVIKADLCTKESTELLSHSYSAKDYSSSKDTSNCVESSESKIESSDSKNSAKEQTSNTSALFVNTPPTTPEHDTDMPSSSLSTSSHEHSQDSNLSIKMTDIHVATDRQYGSDFPEGNASPSSHDGSVGSGNVAGSESSNNEAHESSSHGKRRKESEEVLPPKRKKRGKSKTELKNSKIAGSDSDDYAPDRLFNPEPGSTSPSKVSVTHRSNSPRTPRYHFNLEEGKYLEGERRISFLMEKIQEIRKIYMNLKSEVACIDRRRKRCQRKDKDSFHCSSNGNMEGESTR